MNTQQFESSTSKPTPESGTQEGLLAPQLKVSTILEGAALLARKGDLSRAAYLLAPLSDDANSRIETLDLLAKIYAQQGKIAQAQALWLKALQREPSNLHFLAALRLCAYYGKPRFQQFSLLHLWLLISVVLWFIVAMIVVVGMTI